ncbi:MAG: adaptin [Halobacteriota archaeon]
MVTSNSGRDEDPANDDSQSDASEVDSGSSQLFVAPSFEQVVGVESNTDPASYRTRAPDADERRSRQASDAAASRSRRAHADTDVTVGTTDTDSSTEELSPEEYVDRVHALAYVDPIAAGDRIGDLLVLLESASSPLVESISDTLEWIGYRRPREFVVWADGFAALADASDPDRAFIGIRSLAQLAPVNDTAAAKGLVSAIGRLDVDHTDLRTAALSLVAEVGPDHVEQLSTADRSIANALTDPHPRIRTAAAIAAGALLGANPQRFPQTSMRLFAVLDDDHDTVRTYTHIALANFAIEQPAAIPHKEAVVRRLEAVSDEELGLREGSIAEAIAAVTKVQAGY